MSKTYRDFFPENFKRPDHFGKPGVVGNVPVITTLKQWDIRTSLGTSDGLL
jgi:hypothetical protein